jgi:hypothetical protein
MFKNTPIITYSDFITGEKFMLLAEAIHYYYDQIKLPTNYEHCKIFYTDNYHVEKIFNILPKNKQIILITHNSDRAISHDLACLMPDNICKWFAAKCCV